MRRALELWPLCLLGALACATPSTASDAGCVDAGPNSLCGGPVAFPVRFSGYDYPLADDAGNPITTVLDVFLADEDLSSACGGGRSKLPAFNGLDIQVNGYGTPFDAGASFTSPTVWAYEISWTSDGGTVTLGSAANVDLTLLTLTGSTVTGTFSADMQLLPSGTTPLAGTFSAKNCQGLHQALCLDSSCGN